MFHVIERKSETEIIAKFSDGKVVRLVHETDGDESAYVEGVRIYGNHDAIWDFPHGEDREAAIAEAEQRFREVVTAIDEGKPLNLSDFVMKPKAAPKAAPKTSAKQSKTSAKQSQSEPEPEPTE